MGVPALFRWLNTKYPKTTVRIIEEQPHEINGHLIPVDISKPNPNGDEEHNLYLDMNGIVHPCTHPEDKPPPKNEQEAMVEIFKYLDRIMAMVRPRKLLYMAIDGVAPRAKMNQQRSRRFRSAQEAQQRADFENKIREELILAGQHFPDKEKGERFDSNCITPGTPFMAQLSECLRFYVADRLNKDPGWRNLKVIISDASVPGEGEHKIMDFIRRQRLSPEYDPNTRHVLYGLDADLIMLGLATHEPYFKILREDVFAQRKTRTCMICGLEGHFANQCSGAYMAKKISDSLNGNETPKTVAPSFFIYLKVNILREYLHVDLDIKGLPFPCDLERLIDDWVFMCFFVGNDFLPHLPSLEIREGAIDRLIEIYKRKLPQMGGYLTDSGDVDLGRLQVILSEVGKFEDSVFKKRRDDEMRRRRRDQERDSYQKLSASKQKTLTAAGHASMSQFAVSVKDVKEVQSSSRSFVEQSREIRMANQSAAKSLRASLLTNEVAMSKPATEESKRKVESIDQNAAEAKKVKIDVEESVTIAKEVDIIKKPEINGLEESSSSAEEAIDPDKNDEVRLWEDGWRQRYYQSKFGVAETDSAFRKNVLHEYIIGLVWVLKYYYQGCASWGWYYPFHYAPFASDIDATDLEKDLTIKFEIGKPFAPLEQLMSVLPAGSCSHIPEPLRTLMTEEDSPIYDFYPPSFVIDLNGKKFEWQGVALLPFIDENRLRAAMKDRMELLSSEDQLLNRAGSDLLLVGHMDRLFDTICGLYGRKKITKALKLDCRESDGLSGQVLPDPDACMPGSTFFSPLEKQGCLDIANNNSISALYMNPPKPTENYKFPAKLLPGIRFPPRTLNSSDHDDVRFGTQRGGFQRSNGYHYQSRDVYNSNASYTVEASKLGSRSNSSYDSRRETYPPRQSYRPKEEDRYQPYRRDERDRFESREYRPRPQQPTSDRRYDNRTNPQNHGHNQPSLRGPAPTASNSYSSLSTQAAPLRNNNAPPGRFIYRPPPPPNSSNARPPPVFFPGSLPPTQNNNPAASLPNLAWQRNLRRN